MKTRHYVISMALGVALLAVGGAMNSGALAAQESEQLSMGQMVRITGATVLRGGPASPPVLYPIPLEGNVVGMVGDTLLFETGAEPVYWIPLAAGALLERRATVTDTKRVVLIATGVSGLAGATFAWGWRDECHPNEAAIELGLTTECLDDAQSGGAAALRGFAIGAGVGVAAGLVLGRFAKRQAWVPVRLEGLRFSALSGAGTGAVGLAFRMPLGG